MPEARQVLWVRPDGQGPYGDGSGRDYDNAIHGLLNVPWQQQNLEVWVCGFHGPPALRTTNVNFARIDIASGLADSKTVIRGDYLDDPGVIWGACYQENTPWTDEGDGVFSVPYRLTAKREYCFQDITPQGFRMLKLVDTLEECRDTPGSYTCQPFNGFAAWKVGSKFFVHTTYRGNPSMRVAMPGFGYQFHMLNKQNIVFNRLTYYATRRFNPGEASPNFCEWRRCTIKFGESANIFFYGAVQGNIVHRCDLSVATNGVLFMTPRDPVNRLQRPSNCEVTRNTIHDIGLADSTPLGDPDCHGFGCQGGDRFLVQDNIYDRCGTAIDFYGIGDELPMQPITNNLIRRETVRDCHDSQGVCLAYGVEIHQAFGHTGDMSGNQILHCVVRSPGSTAAYKTSPIHHDIPIRGCLAENVQNGFLMNRVVNEVPGRLHVRECTVRNPSERFVYVYAGRPYMPAMINDLRINLDLNAYLGTAGLTEFEIGDYNQTFTQWQANGSAFDPNSTIDRS
jgi:hypothetical protein